MNKTEQVRFPLPDGEDECFDFLRYLDLVDSDSDNKEFDRLTRLATQLFDVPMAEISIGVKNREWTLSCQGPSEPIRNLFESISTQNAGTHDDPLVVNDLTRDERFEMGNDSSQEKTIRSFAYVPISLKESTFGAFRVCDYQPQEYTKSDIDDLGMLVEQVKELIERRWLKRNLRWSQRAKPDIFGEPSDAVIQINPEGKIEYTNQQAEKTFGYGSGELVGETIEKLVPEGSGRLEEKINQYTDDPSTQPINNIQDLSAVKRDGTEIPVGASLIPLRASDRMKIIVILNDMSSRKSPRNQLKFLNKVLEEAPVGVLITDPSQDDNPIIYANEKFQEMTGYEEKEVLGRNCRFLQGEDTRTEPVRQMREAVDNRKSVTVQLKNYRKDGTMFWNEVNIAPLLNHEGELMNFVGFQRNVSSRKEQDQRFENMAKSIDQIFWTYDPNQDNFLYVSPAFEEIFGRNLQELLEKPRLWFEMIHPNDREKVSNYWKTRGYSTYEMKYRIMRPDGEIRWVQEQGYPVRKDGETIEQYVGVTTDVTRREALQRERQKFVQIVQNSGDFIARLSPDGVINYVNNAAIGYTDFSRKKDLIDRPFEELIAESERDKLRTIVRSLTDSDFWFGEIEFRRADDRENPITVMNAFVIHDTEGPDPPEIALIATDITDQVQIQKELKGLVDEKETLLKEVHHRVKNNLQLITSLLNMQIRRNESDSIESVLQESKNRISSMALLHEQLYQSESLARIDPSTFIRKLSRTLKATYVGGRDDIKFDVSVDVDHLELEQAIPTVLILNELISNAFEHAFRDRAGSVRIRFEQNDETYKLVVSDSGQGLPDGFDLEQTDSLGWTLVRTLAEGQLNGELVVENQNGLKVTVRFES